MGRLLGPRDRKPDVGDLPWAADNDAFNEAYSDARYLAMLDAIAGTPGCLFVTVPDVVGDRDATLKLWDRWAPEVWSRSLPAAYVAQDGEDGMTCPDSEAIFIGGTDAYKHSDSARSTARFAKASGRWLHMGRVNTMPRIRFAHSIGVDSIDGTKWSRWTDTWKHELRILPHRQQALI